MRVHVVIDESGFFLPKYLEYVGQHLPHGVEIVGVTVLLNPLSAPTVYSHLRSHLSDIGFLSSSRLGFRALAQLGQNLMRKLGLPARPGSVFETARSLGIPVRRVKDVNDPATLIWIAAGTPDLLLSSCSQIFGRDLLNVGRLGAINRHSSLLPSYGGLLPIFHALSRGEERVGSSIHVMTPKVDAGTVIAQSGFMVGEEMTVYECYERSFLECGPLTIESLAKVKNLDSVDLEDVDFGIQNDLAESYFSVPSREDWVRFHRTGRKFC